MGRILFRNNSYHLLLRPKLPPIMSAITSNGYLVSLLACPYLQFILLPKIPPTPHQFSRTRPFNAHNFRVQVLVARGLSEWFVRVVVSAATFVGRAPAVIVAAPAPTWPSIPMTAKTKPLAPKDRREEKTKILTHPIPLLPQRQSRLVPLLKMPRRIHRAARMPLGPNRPILREGRCADD